MCTARSSRIRIVAQENLGRRRLAPDSLIYPVPIQHKAIAVRGALFLGDVLSVKMSRTTARSREVLILLFCLSCKPLHANVCEW